ncbi:MAG: hypothetical protein M0R37_15555 [Bacteroidales bacterium]|jgi:hypothetical protein|nr:hypothetical protein [Bacteroidales bacterium]
MNHERIADDNYATPPLIARWAVVHALKLLGAMEPPPYPHLRALEPACGDTAPFGMAMAQRGLQTMLQDLRDVNGEAIRELWKREHGVDLAPRAPVEILSCWDYLTAQLPTVYHLIAVNPPFKMAEQFVRRVIDRDLDGHGVAVFLLRLGFLESQARSALFSERPPAEVHVLTARPSFAHGKTDSTAYGLFFWRGSAADAQARNGGYQTTTLHWIDNAAWEPRRGRVRIEKGAEHGTP